MECRIYVALVGSVSRAWIRGTEAVASEDHYQSLLIVGTGAGLKCRVLAFPDGNAVLCVNIEDVTPDLLARIRPRVIMTSLVSGSFDCIDIAERLDAAGYDGCLQVLTGRIPRPQIVLNEIQTQFPDLSVEVGQPLPFAS